MKTSNVEVWLGWSIVSAAENVRVMPEWVAKAVHPDCERPTHTWAMLVGVQKEREALFAGERLPREVLGHPTATMEASILYLERQAHFFAAALAWGDFADDWK